MKELLTYVAQNLVEHPEQVSVNEVEGDDETVLELRVAPEDMGKVIGKQGKIAKAMRTIVRAATPRDSKKYVVEIRERGGEAVDSADEE